MCFGQLTLTEVAVFDGLVTYELWTCTQSSGSAAQTTAASPVAAYELAEEGKAPPPIGAEWSRCAVAVGVVSSGVVPAAAESDRPFRARDGGLCTTLCRDVHRGTVWLEWCGQAGIGDTESNRHRGVARRCLIVEVDDPFRIAGKGIAQLLLCVLCDLIATPSDHFLADRAVYAFADIWPCAGTVTRASTTLTAACLSAPGRLPDATFVPATDAAAVTTITVNVAAPARMSGAMTMPLPPFVRSGQPG